MMDQLTAGDLPQTYPRTFVLRSTPPHEGGTLAAAFAANQRLVDAVAPEGGLALLTQLERRGEIPAAIPVGGRAGDATASLPQSAGTLSVLAAQTYDDAPASATIVKVAAAVDLDDLLVQLEADPQVSFAEKVPVRYVATTAPPAGVVDPMSSVEQRIAALERAEIATAGTGAWNLRRIGLPDVEALGGRR
jgi:hypothetical protein